jgi:hypothetical protein
MSEKHTLINPRRFSAGTKTIRDENQRERERERDGASWSGKETEIKRLGAFVGIRGEKLGWTAHRYRVPIQTVLLLLLLLVVIIFLFVL